VQCHGLHDERHEREAIPRQPASGGELLGVSRVMTRVAFTEGHRLPRTTGPLLYFCCMRVRRPVVGTGPVAGQRLFVGPAIHNPNCSVLAEGPEIRIKPVGIVR
jgi:hypothetical protein